MPKEQDNSELKKTEFVTRQKFQKLCVEGSGILPYATLHTDITKGLVIEKQDNDGHNLINIKLPINAEYIKMRRLRSKQAEESRQSNVQTKKAEVELLKLQEELALKRIVRMRAEGKLIPADLAQITMRTHLKEVKQQFYHAAERITNDCARKYGATKKDMADMKGDLIAVINASIEKADEGMAMQIKSIQDEYREIKGS